MRLIHFSEKIARPNQRDAVGIARGIICGCSAFQQVFHTSNFFSQFSGAHVYWNPMGKPFYFAAVAVNVPVERIWRMCPRKYRRTLPVCTRPSLFGSD